MTYLLDSAIKPRTIAASARRFAFSTVRPINACFHLAYQRLDDPGDHYRHQSNIHHTYGVAYNDTSNILINTF